MFRSHGPAYRTQFGNRMLPSHLRAMQDIARCRTETLGGQVYPGETCQAYHYSDHSCKNRHGPKCQHDQAEQGLEDHKSLLRPVPHFMVTLTLPDELRALARHPQKTLYHLRLRRSAEALQELALAPRFIGGRIGMVGVLPTWTRALHYQPHVQYIVAGGGLSPQGSWLPSRQVFLVHVKPLSVLFRAKFRAQLHKTELFPLVDERAWSKDWVVHCEPIGSGEDAFRYLAPYIVRVAISNNRIITLEDGQVTFQDKDSATDHTTASTVTAEECIRRFLQHVLPDRFIKVCYDGFLSPGNRHVLAKVSTVLGASTVETTTTGQHPDGTEPTHAREGPRCPQCGSIVILVETLRPRSRWPP